MTALTPVVENRPFIYAVPADILLLFACNVLHKLICINFVLGDLVTYIIGTIFVL